MTPMAATPADECVENAHIASFDRDVLLTSEKVSLQIYAVNTVFVVPSTTELSTRNVMR